MVALSNLKESDEDEAVQSAENFGQSIAQAGFYEHKGKMRVWGRSDMDAVGIWGIGKGEEDDIEVCLPTCRLNLDTDDVAARSGSVRYGTIQVERIYITQDWRFHDSDSTRREGWKERQAEVGLSN